MGVLVRGVPISSYLDCAPIRSHQESQTTYLLPTYITIPTTYILNYYYKWLQCLQHIPLRKISTTTVTTKIRRAGIRYPLSGGRLSAIWWQIIIGSCRPWRYLPTTLPSFSTVLPTSYTIYKIQAAVYID